jgi:urocanate hydratase
MPSDADAMRAYVGEGIPEHLLEHPGIDDSVDHAPPRRQVLTNAEKRLALRNALRYFPTRLHSQLSVEFAKELSEYGRIWMMRRPILSMLILQSASKLLR